MQFECRATVLLECLQQEKISISEYTLRYETVSSGKSRESILENMEEVLKVMEHSAEQARKEPIQSVSGLTGGDSFRYSQYLLEGRSILGEMPSQAAAMALSCSEVNAAMRRIAACPTAGSCGIVPGALLSAAENRGVSREKLAEALFTASGVGIILGTRATLSGAEGGCQAECGSAAAMAAAAVTEMLGGTPEQAFHAGAMALKSVMGLVCDPVAGLVEIPCIKRNASGAVNALLCADMALSGVESRIPFDDVVDAMYAVGCAMSSNLRETARGGLAVTPAGLQLKRQVFSPGAPGSEH